MFFKKKSKDKKPEAKSHIVGIIKHSENRRYRWTSSQSQIDLFTEIYTLFVDEMGNRTFKRTVYTNSPAKGYSDIYYTHILPWGDGTYNFENQLPSLNDIKSGAKPYRNYDERIPEYTEIE